jgi:hypothetical protein
MILRMKGIVSVNSMNHLIFVMEMSYFKVRTEFLNIILLNFLLQFFVSHPKYFCKSDVTESVNSFNSDAAQLGTAVWACMFI